MSDNDQATTPMLETLLERMNVLTTEMQELRSFVEKGFAGIREEMNHGFAGIREEMNHGFRKIDRRLDAMSGDIHKLRGDVNYLESKMEKLEREPA